MSAGVPTWLGTSITGGTKTLRRVGLSRLGRLVRRPLFYLFAVITVLVIAEMRTSWAQSKLLALASAKFVYAMAPGPSPALAVAPPGPYDQRLGYTELPRFLELTAGAYAVREQARSSESMLRFTHAGGFPVYSEKSQAGLMILDREGKPVFEARYPRDIYKTFDDIPPLAVRTLLYVENRKILDDESPYQNPAVEWNRLAKAAGDLAINKVYPGHPVSGGSTLATQLEKVRHSPEGRTPSTMEKFRQMIAASLRAYRNGEDTTQTRREIVRDYLNSFPLSAQPGYGEVAGLPEGLRVWFGSDPAEVSRLLRLPPEETRDPAVLQAQATAYRQVLSLILALNRPSYYLRHDKAALDARADGYLRLFELEGILPAELARAALATKLEIQRDYSAPDVSADGDKGTLALRSDLLATFGVENTYALDRLDMTVASTFDGAVQKKVSEELRALADPAKAAAAGLSGYRLLQEGDYDSVIYSFTLYERGEQGNLLRVESDNYDQPLSINRGTRLELGSTAKLRTLVSYLEIVAGLHGKYKDATPAELRAALAQAHDHITRWLLWHFLTTPERGLEATLDAALDRGYSASPTESFFTGGGLHTFSNFDPEDNGRAMAVREGFRKSVNLVFIRLMRDVVDYHAWRLPNGASPAMLSNPNDPHRQEYLSRFADLEGRVFLEQFWQDHQGRNGVQALDAVAARANANLRKLSVIFRSAKPAASQDDLIAFIRRAGGVNIDADWAAELYKEYDPARFNWNDLGYLAGVHPLELWLLRHHLEHPDTTFASAVQASADERQEVYQWLFRKKNFDAQNSRIRTVLEQDAFAGVLASWKRQGFPFAEMVPSYASALGSSGDNPAALAELAGIILNDGVRRPSLRVREIQFGENTPYETRIERTPPAGERVYPSELAKIVREAMFDVVENGTARRAWGSISVDQTKLPIGGKTGTGDNRIEVRGPNGELRDSRAINRTATFVFVIGDRFFGTVTAYVPGSAADRYNFTSALPVQLFRHLAPHLDPLLRQTSTSPEPKGALTAGRKAQPREETARSTPASHP